MLEKSALSPPPPSPNVDISLCVPPCAHPPTALLDTILLDVLLLLPYRDLLKARAVNRHWHTLITTRRLLRSKCFLLPPTPGLPFNEWRLHPIHRMVEYWGYSLHVPGPPREGIEERIRFRGRMLKYEPVSTIMASSPAVKLVGVWLAGGMHWIECETGVTLWRLFEGFDELIQARRDTAEAGKQFMWDHKVFPFAGFRVIPKLSNHDESRLVITPEFYDTTAIIAQLRDGGWVRESVQVPFCFELPE